MIIGVPAEVKNNEFRVALTPAGAADLAGRGHQVLIQSGAGLASGFTDEQYRSAGAQLLDGAEGVWEAAELVLDRKSVV